MKKVFLEKSLNLIKNYYSYDDIKLQEIKYGLETLYITITKTVVIFALALLLNIFKELMIMMVFYGFLRLFAHGLHAKKSWQCWVTSVPLFLILPYLSTILLIPKEIYLVLGTFITIMIYFYAPADTEKKPIVNKKRRMFFKITSTVISIIYLVLIYFLKNNILINIIFSSMLVELVLISPLTYKIFNLKYNNYKTYLQKNNPVSI